MMSPVNSNWSNCSQVHIVILNKLGKRDYPISTKSKTNFVTFVRLKYSPLIHSKSETIPTLQQNLDKPRNSELASFKGGYCKICTSFMMSRYLCCFGQVTQPVTRVNYWEIFWTGGGGAQTSVNLHYDLIMMKKPGWGCELWEQGGLWLDNRSYTRQECSPQVLIIYLIISIILQTDFIIDFIIYYVIGLIIDGENFSVN